jgi:plasmid stabilization system protein ParE
MKYRIVLTSPANAEIGSAVNWYQRRNPKTAFRFLSRTRATISRIRQNPNRFPLIKGVIRRALVPRFPYSIYFFLKNELVFILAVRHQRQSDILRIGDNGHG